MKHLFENFYLYSGAITIGPDSITCPLCGFTQYKRPTGGIPTRLVVHSKGRRGAGRGILWSARRDTSGKVTDRFCPFCTIKIIEAWGNKRGVPERFTDNVYIQPAPRRIYEIAFENSQPEDPTAWQQFKEKWNL